MTLARDARTLAYHLAVPFPFPCPSLQRLDAFASDQQAQPYLCSRAVSHHSNAHKTGYKCGGGLSPGRLRVAGPSRRTRQPPPQTRGAAGPAPARRAAPPTRRRRRPCAAAGMSAQAQSALRSFVFCIDSARLAPLILGFPRNKAFRGVGLSRRPATSVPGKKVCLHRRLSPAT